MFRYYIIFIYLFATAIAANAQRGNTADSLYAAGDYSMAAVEYERMAFLSESLSATQSALSSKALCYERMGKFDKAAEIYDRFAVEYEDVYRQILCHFLSNHHEKVAELCSTMIFTQDSVNDNILLMNVLSLNELRQWEKAHEAAEQLCARLPLDKRTEVERLVDSLYSRQPRMKNRKAAEWLSIVPGLGHLYAGYPAEAATAFVVNGAALGFGIWQVVERCYLMAYIGGAVLLSATWPGTMQSAAFFADKRNYKRSSAFNSKVKEALVDALQQTK